VVKSRSRGREGVLLKLNDARGRAFGRSLLCGLGRMVAILLGVRGSLGVRVVALILVPDAGVAREMAVAFSFALSTWRAGCPRPLPTLRLRAVSSGWRAQRAFPVALRHDCDVEVSSQTYGRGDGGYCGQAWESRRWIEVLCGGKSGDGGFVIAFRPRV